MNNKLKIMCMEYILSIIIVRQINIQYNTLLQLLCLSIYLPDLLIMKS